MTNQKPMNKQESKIIFPDSRPDADVSASFLWKIQQDLLIRAEHAFGPRDLTKEIYQPVFRNDGPVLVNTPTCDGAFAALSLNAAAYWPTVIYEMAHETVHLLDPIPGYTTWIEEGAAVAFAIEMSNNLTSHPMKPLPASNYEVALKLVHCLPGPIFDSIRQVRISIGCLSGIKSDDLRRLFPMLDIATLDRLAQQCIPR